MSKIWFSKLTKENGKKSGIQRYKCLICNKNFFSKRRPEKLEKSIFKEYVYKRQTLANLSEKYSKTKQWVHYKIREYEPGDKIHNPRPVNLVCDATFYGKRRDKLGTLVFQDNDTKEVLIWKHINSEKAADYKQLLKQLLELVIQFSL